MLGGLMYSFGIPPLHEYTVFKWCVKSGIPYKTWDKAESQFNMFKQQHTNKMLKRKEKTGDDAEELEEWEKLLADCEPEDPKYNHNKPKVCEKIPESLNKNNLHFLGRHGILIFSCLLFALFELICSITKS